MCQGTRASPAPQRLLNLEGDTTAIMTATMLTRFTAETITIGYDAQIRRCSKPAAWPKEALRCWITISAEGQAEMTVRVVRPRGISINRARNSRRQPFPSSFSRRCAPTTFFRPLLFTSSLSYFVNPGGHDRLFLDHIHTHFCSPYLSLSAQNAALGIPPRSLGHPGRKGPARQQRPGGCWRWKLLVCTWRTRCADERSRSQPVSKGARRC